MGPEYPVLVDEAEPDFETLDAGGHRSDDPGRWRRWAVAALAFGLGIAAGVLPSAGNGPGGSGLAVSAGQLHVNGSIRATAADSAIVPITVALHADGTGDVEVLELRPVGWSSGRVSMVPRSVTIVAGQWRNVAGTVAIDCTSPRPQVPGAVRVRLRTGEVGPTTAVLPLPTLAKELIQSWRAYCER